MVWSDDLILLKCRQLLNAGMPQSADRLLSFARASLGSESLDHLMLVAETARALRQWRSAIVAYERSLVVHSGDLSLGGEVGAPCLGEIKLSLAQCFMELQLFQEAKVHLVSIPNADRTLVMWNALAACHEALDEYRDAVVCLNSVLALEPYAIEASFKLATFGSYEAGKVTHPSLPDIDRVIEASALSRGFKYHEAISILESLCTRFQNDPRFWVDLAVTYELNDDVDKAYFSFQHAYSLNRNLVDGIDIYCSILLSQGKTAKVCVISSRLLQATEHRVESWVAAACCSLAKGQNDRALAYSEQAIKINPRHWRAMYTKGIILQKLGQDGEATKFLKRAHKLQPCAKTYEALVNSALTMQRVREALAITKEMSLGLGSHIRTPICVANVLQIAGQHQKAMLAYQTALKKDGNCIEAITGISSLLCGQGEYDRAIEILMKYLPYNSTEWIHIRIGDVYMAMKDHQAALHHFFIALSLNPESERAKEAANQIERELRGERDEDENSLMQEDAADFDEDSLIA